jgi:hypothetical protein
VVVGAMASAPAFSSNCGDRQAPPRVQYLCCCNSHTNMYFVQVLCGILLCDQRGFIHLHIGDAQAAGRCSLLWTGRLLPGSLWGERSLSIRCTHAHKHTHTSKHAHTRSTCARARAHTHTQPILWARSCQVGSDAAGRCSPRILPGPFPTPAREYISDPCTKKVRSRDILPNHLRYRSRGFSCSSPPWSFWRDGSSTRKSNVRPEMSLRILPVLSGSRSSIG